MRSTPDRATSKSRFHAATYREAHEDLFWTHKALLSDLTAACCGEINHKICGEISITEGSCGKIVDTSRQKVVPIPITL